MLEALRVSVADPDYFDSDWNLTFHCDAAPDPGPTVLSLKAPFYLTGTSLMLVLSSYFRNS
jgi:hypothetical protein